MSDDNRVQIEKNRLLLQELVAGGRTGQPMRLDRRRRRTPRMSIQEASFRALREELRRAENRFLEEALDLPPVIWHVSPLDS